MNATTDPGASNVSPPQIAQRLPALLPAIYRQDSFLARYLWAFEQALLDIEQRIEGLARYFDPVTAPLEFLPWLSSWVAFALRADLGESQQRQFLSRVAPLYRRRGTLQNLRELLTIFTRGGVPTIEEDPAQPYYFKVTMRLPPQNTPDMQVHQSAIAHALIDLEKPAHTHYDLVLLFPTMQIGKTSTIGVDTLLGTDTGDPTAPPASTAPARKS